MDLRRFLQRPRCSLARHCHEAASIRIVKPGRVAILALPRQTLKGALANG